MRNGGGFTRQTVTFTLGDIRYNLTLEFIRKKRTYEKKRRRNPQSAALTASCRGGTTFVACATFPPTEESPLLKEPFLRQPINKKPSPGRRLWFGDKFYYLIRISVKTQTFHSKTPRTGSKPDRVLSRLSRCIIQIRSLGRISRRCSGTQSGGGDPLNSRWCRHSR